MADWWAVSDGSGEKESNAGEVTLPLPDISDIEGATTGPLRRPTSPTDNPPDASAPEAAETSVDPAWAAPSVDDLKEPVVDEPAREPTPGPTAGEPTVPASGGGQPTQRFDVVTPDASPPPANPTVSIDAKQVGVSGAPSRAVSTAAAVPFAESDPGATVQAKPPDPTGDVADELTVTADPHASPVGRPTGSDPDQDRSSGGKGRRRPGAKLAKILFLSVLGLIVLFVGAWLLDTARTSNQVLRNTSLGDVPIGGLDRDELGAVIDELDADLATSPLTVAVGDVQIATNPAALGAELDRDAVIDEALAAGRDGGLLERPIRWVGSFSSEREVEPAYRVDPATATAAVEGVIDDALDDPLEPTLAVGDNGLALSPGSDGVTVDPAEIAERLPSVLSGSEPSTLALSPVATMPELSNETVEGIVDEANEATAQPVVFQVQDQTAEVEPVAIRDWVRLDATGAEPSWMIDADAAVADLQPRFPVLGTDDQQARFEVVDGVPEILPATETVVCCTTESVEGIRDALLEPAPAGDDEAEDDGDSDDDGEDAPLRTIILEPEIVSPDAGVAELESLGIVEEVSTFTTNHPCCGPRVTNIQRFADLMRGVVIRPGEDFSLNGHVGRRTIENGFVADQAIANGILEPQVGGGISQFATTFFNASFFAGLDFNEYQSHSLFIDRYPRGREATISFPRPDLSVNNSTDYGILVWTSYTETSITVTFYSTAHIDVTAGDLVRSSQGACTRYTTPRTRTYPDGTVVEDSVFAVYRPGEGLDCNGNSTRPEEPDGATTPDDDGGTDG